MSGAAVRRTYLEFETQTQTPFVRVCSRRASAAASDYRERLEES